MENHFFQTILHYLRAHPHAGEWFTFLVAFLESLPIIGTIVPGTITMTIVGILIGTSALPAIWSLTIASGAAFLGDSIGYFIGYYYNVRLRTMWPFRKYPKWLSMGEAFFKKHGGKSIVFGRFIGPARSTVPLIAGLLKLTWLRFAIAAIPSAVLWAIMYLTPGILLGALSREIPKAETTQFFLYSLTILIIIWVAFWLIQHFFIQLARIINFATDKFWNYLTRNGGGRFLIRLITNQQKPNDHHQLTLFFVSALSGILFLILLVDVRLHGALTQINFPFFHFLQTIRTPLCNKIFTVITIMGAPKTLEEISGVMIIAMLLTKQFRTAIHLFAAFLLTGGAVTVFKHISHSLRPQGFEMVAHTSSFPSGHTTFSFVLFSFIAFLIMQITKKNLRWIPFTLSSVLIGLIAFSRMYLGAHWLIDIFGSIFLGLTILLLCIISYRRMPHIKQAFRLSPLLTAILLIVSLCIPWAKNIDHLYATVLHDTTPVWPKQKITTNAWWQSPLRFTPLYRNNRLGKPFQPFNVQWQGSLEEITNTLKNQGWEPVPRKQKLKTTLQRFSSHQAQYHMPLLPWLYRNKPPTIFLIKHVPLHKRIIELRLWESDVHLQPGNKPLWIGTIDIRIPPKVLLSLKEHAIISLSGNGGLNQLYEDTADFQRKVIKAPITQQPENISALHWNGKILLIRN